MSNEARTEAVALAELTSRVATLERNGRRWRFAFAALALMVIGVAADDAARDMTFGTVKASKFEVVAPSGESVGFFSGRIDKETGMEEAAILLTSDHKKKMTFVYAGQDLKFVDRTKE